MSQTKSTRRLKPFNLGDNPKHFIYLTTWAETTLNMHLIASFLTCLYGYIYGKLCNNNGHLCNQSISIFYYAKLTVVCHICTKHVFLIKMLTYCLETFNIFINLDSSSFLTRQDCERSLKRRRY